MNTMINTTLGYIQQGESYLMLHRVKKEHDINKDKWIGIGGKFENMETPEECILREALEETGLTLNSWTYHGIVTFVTLEDSFTEFMHLFSSTDFSGELKECDEGVLEWYPKERIPALNLWEGDLIFLDLMEKKAPFFSLKLVYDNGTLVQAILNGRALVREEFGKWS